MNSSESWVVSVRGRARKALVKFPAHDRERIVVILDSLAANPYAGDVWKMKGEEHSWRCRVGDYRIFYELFPNERVIYVYKIERRTSTTY